MPLILYQEQLNMHMYVYTQLVCVHVCVCAASMYPTSSGLYLWADIVTLVLENVGYKAY